MRVTLPRRHVRAVTERLGSSHADGLTFGQAVEVTALMGAGYRGALERLGQGVAAMMDDVVATIETAQREIAHLQPNRLSAERLPQAGRELGYVVQATEEATAIIMEAAETAMSLSEPDPAAYRSRVDAEMMRIIEACAFQDLTGQRLANVAETLKRIEERVASIAATLSVAQADEVLPETEAEARRRRLILHGPSAPTEGIGQDEIDRLLGF